MTDSMNDHIPEEKTDERFFYARELVYHSSGRWEIKVDPDACLTGAADDPAVAHPLEPLTETRPSVTRTDGRTVYRGRIPFSAGVILLVGDEFALLRRDADAPSDPLMWTSPAGRCDHTPGYTALQEFYEELLITVDDQPVFVEFDRNGQFEPVYAATLRRKDRYVPPGEWRRVSSSVPSEYADLLVEVVTRFGAETYADSFWPFWDEHSSTLELRQIVGIDPRVEGESLEFEDGEWDRAVRLFSAEEYRNLDPDDLVPTNAAFREYLPA